MAKPLLGGGKKPIISHEWDGEAAMADCCSTPRRKGKITAAAIDAGKEALLAAAARAREQDRAGRPETQTGR